MFKCLFAKSTLAFAVDEPNIVITKDFTKCKNDLALHGTEYNTVSDGYITFPAKLFHTDIQFICGIHYNLNTIQYIEIFRPIEYSQSTAFDIHQSYKQLSDVLKKQFGNPIHTTGESIGGQQNEQWICKGFIINHYLLDRFGLEEHLHINFFKE
ncbi:MAG: hypothetical protein Q4E21_03690 [Clostridia bacterium]|nr:hypothetical protein [Clostridia bacterium]